MAALYAAMSPAPSNAQQVADPGFKSVGRGAPLAAVLQSPPRATDTSATGGDAFERYVEGMRRYPFVGAINIQRAWAQLWEKYFESGMQRPEEKDPFDFR
jgi:hypothetical protein